MRGVRRVLSVAVVSAAALTVGLAAPALASAPSVSTGGSSGVTYQSAVLSGTVTTGGLSTEVYFQYGPTNTYGMQSAPTQLAAAPRAVPVSITITGLTAGTTYHYRLVATNSTGTALGSGRSLVTASITSIAGSSPPLSTKSPIDSSSLAKYCATLSSTPS